MPFTKDYHIIFSALNLWSIQNYSKYPLSHCITSSLITYTQYNVLGTYGMKNIFKFNNETREKGYLQKLSIKH